MLASRQWYPGHIAKTEKELKDQLKLMDVVIEVRDARIPMSTSHPQVLHSSSDFVHFLHYTLDSPFFLMYVLLKCLGDLTLFNS